MTQYSPFHWKCTSKFNVEKKEIEARVISRCNPMLPITRTSMGTFLFEDNTILTIPLELVELALPNVEKDEIKSHVTSQCNLVHSQ